MFKRDKYCLKATIHMLPRIAVLGLTIFVVAMVTSSPIAYSQQQTGFNWFYPAYDNHNSNFNPQNVINKDNINRLELKWLFQVPEDPFKIPYVAPSLGLQTSPLIVNGLLYISTYYNRIIALNLETGSEVWQYQVNVSAFEGKKHWWPVLSQKDLHYQDGTLYMMASDCTVYAFDAQTGEVQWTIPDTCVNIPGNTGRYFGEHAPVVFKDKLLVRLSTQEGGGRGFLSAYDLKTRNLLWRWYSVPPAGGDPNWHLDAVKGNINPYPGDWGTSDLIGGGALWTLMALDEEDNAVYFGTGSSPDSFDAALRPGPNLFADSIVSIDLNTGQLRWYYQTNTHAMHGHEPGWSTMLANIQIDGQMKKVVVAATKNDHIYVLDAKTGKPVYEPIKIGKPYENIINDNAGNSADMTASQKQLLGKIWCPGVNGGVEHPPSFDGKILYVATQRVCGQILTGPVTYKGKIMDGFVYGSAPGARQNSSLFAIDLSSRKIKWVFEMPNRYQSASIVTSGGVVYAIDRAGYMYALNAETGQLLKRWSWGGLGAAGVTIGATARGQMYLLAPSGGGQVGTNSAGVIVAFALPNGVSPGTSPSPDQGLSVIGDIGLMAIAIVAVVIVLAIVMMMNSRKKKAQ